MAPRPFARHYDAIYSDKNYDRDVAVFERLAGAGLAGRKVLELGAGTGNHSIRLATRVRRLVSIEIDGDFFEVLRSKIARAANVACTQEPVEDLAEAQFDAAGALFHVLNYLAPRHLESFLAAIAERLNPGAPLVADLWNGDAVMNDPPRNEVRKKTAGGVTVSQAIRPDYQPGARDLTLHYDIGIDGDGVSERIAERLKIHLWLREELEQMLERAGFTHIEFWDYRSFPSRAAPTSWFLWLRALRKTGGAGQ